MIIQYGLDNVKQQYKQEVGKTEGTERVSVKEAAKLLGLSQQGVREHMERGLFKNPIGEVTNPSGKRRQYHIYRNMLNRHLWISGSSMEGKG